jgi:F0F1-type ATP synthase assembly protein I
LLGIGWFFATAIVLGVGVGLWLDAQTGLEPVFTLVGTLLGLTVALVGGFRMLLPFLRRLSNEPPARRD